MLAGSGRPRKACGQCKTQKVGLPESLPWGEAFKSAWVADGRQVRCSGEKPSCKRCIRLRRTCTYASDVVSGYVASQSREAFSPPRCNATNEFERNGFPPGRPQRSSAQFLLLPHEESVLRFPAQEHYLGIPSTLLSSLIDVFYSHIYNASLLLHKRLFLESLTRGTARPHLVLSVCAFAAVCDTYPLSSVLFSVLTYHTQLLSGCKQPNFSP